jgi:hypothetical protein
MNSLVKLSLLTGGALFGGFLSVVLWKLMTGGISLSYLLDGDVRDPNSDDGSGFRSSPSAGRAQALVVTLFVAGWYLLQVIHNPRQFPQLPAAMLGALAGSHVTYLGGKAHSMLFARPNQEESSE